MSDVRCLFANFPWWFPEPHLAGVRAGSRWPFSRTTNARPDRWVPQEYVPAPLFMQFAASYVKKHCPGSIVHFRDSIALRESYESFYRAVRTGGYDYIFIESATPSWEHDKQVLFQLCATHPGTKLVVTGPIATLREKLFDEAPIHAVLLGEYEKNSVKVVNGASGVLDFDFLSEADMAEQPFPAMGSLYVDKYWDACPKGQEYPHFQVWGSRGCPFVCSFCSWPAVMTGDDPRGEGGRKIRFYHHDYLLAWLTEWKAKFPAVRSVYWDDDTANLGDKHTLEVCEVMRKIGLPWTMMTRIDTVKRETWKEMRDSGCRGVKVGIESGVQRVIDEVIHKQLDLAKAKETIRYLKQIGMAVHVTLSYGHPGETRDEMMQTRAYLEDLKRIGVDTWQESGVAHLEGTPLDMISQGETLKRFPGAKMDGDYIKDHDGAKKFARLALEMAK